MDDAQDPVAAIQSTQISLYLAGDTSRVSRFETRPESYALQEVQTSDALKLHPIISLQMPREGISSIHEAVLGSSETSSSTSCSRWNSGGAKSQHPKPRQRRELAAARASGLEKQLFVFVLTGSATRDAPEA